MYVDASIGANPWMIRFRLLKNWSIGQWRSDTFIEHHLSHWQNRNRIVAPSMSNYIYPSMQYQHHHGPIVIATVTSRYHNNINLGGLYLLYLDSLIRIRELICNRDIFRLLWLGLNPGSLARQSSTLPINQP